MTIINGAQLDRYGIELRRELESQLRQGRPELVVALNWDVPGSLAILLAVVNCALWDRENRARQFEKAQHAMGSTESPGKTMIERRQLDNFREIHRLNHYRSEVMALIDHRPSSKIYQADHVEVGLAVANASVDAVAPPEAVPGTQCLIDEAPAKLDTPDEDVPF